MRRFASSRAVARPAAPAPMLTTGSGIVDRTAAFAVEPQHLLPLAAEHSTLERDAARAQVLVRCGEHGALIEAHAVGVLAERAPDHASHTAPQHGAQTHGARLARRVKLV